VTTSTFADLGVSEPIRRAVDAQGYVTPTPIQQSAIPLLLDGRDLFGIAQTGTGKTAAFVLPLLQRLSAAGAQRRGRGPSALILAPTRELAAQIAEAIEAYGRHLSLRVAVVFGGVGQAPQVAKLRRGLDILVATPGRLLDLVAQGHARLDTVTTLVLDEADRMLDMGFIHDVRRIVDTLPADRHSMVFSATMPAEITRLAKRLLRNPERIEMTPSGSCVDRVEQRVHFVATAEKRALLGSVLQDPQLSRVIVFTRTKHGANRVSTDLSRIGIAAEAMHGNKSQAARQASLDRFRKGTLRVLVATDIAARGIDVDAVSHIINYDLPNVAETYVHRIGRTGRAGLTGIALSFCDRSERPFLSDIEKLTGHRIPVVGGSNAALDSAAPTAPRRHADPRPADTRSPAKAARRRTPSSRRRAQRGKGMSHASQAELSL
jgi:ATP-dependent RNA helicase RhlE